MNLNSIKSKSVKAVISVFRFAILLFIGYIVFYPFLYALLTSIRPIDTLYDPTRQWIPESFTLENLKTAINFMNYWKSLSYTFVIEIVSALMEVISCSVVAYGLSRFDFKIKKICIAILFITILVPTPMIIIPLVRNYAYLDFFGILQLFNTLTGIDLRPNLINSVLSFYLPSILGVGIRSGIFIFIYMQFFKGLPKELEEAAYIDGAGPIKTFTRIAIPSSSVVILTVTVFSLVWHWNDYYMAAMCMPGYKTLGVTIANYEAILQSVGYWHGYLSTNSYILSGCVLFVLPILIIYMILQRGFIESIDRVGITG